MTAERKRRRAPRRVTGLGDEDEGSDPVLVVRDDLPERSISSSRAASPRNADLKESFLYRAQPRTHSPGHSRTNSGQLTPPAAAVPAAAPPSSGILPRVSSQNALAQSMIPISLPLEDERKRRAVVDVPAATGPELYAGHFSKLKAEQLRIRVRQIGSPLVLPDH